jgi:hypothetical protein
MSRIRKHLLNESDNHGCSELGSHKDVDMNLPGDFEYDGSKIMKA